MTNIDTLKKRLLYQSQHRGMREMDLVLGGFAERFLPEMDEAQLQEFEALLAFSDQEIYGWIFENKLIPQEGPVRLLGQIKASLTR